MAGSYPVLPLNPQLCQPQFCVWVGTTIPKDVPIDAEMRIQMKFTLSHIHSAGYIHGNIAQHNFYKRGERIFLVDLETLAVGSTVEMEDELVAVDALWASNYAQTVLNNFLNLAKASGFGTYDAFTSP